MTQNELTAAVIAVGVGFAVLRGIFRMLRNLGRGDTGQMDRINAAAKKVLADQQQTMRSSVPTTDAKGIDGKPHRKSSIATAAKAKQRPIRAASPQKAQGSSAALLSQIRHPAVVRRGLLTAKEPVIQRRR
jgi:hypothetical protein